MKQIWLFLSNSCPFSLLLQFAVAEKSSLYITNLISEYFQEAFPFFTQVRFLYKNKL